MFGFLKKHEPTAEEKAIETEHHRRRLMQLTAHKPAVLRMDADRESDRVGELARGCIVEVFETVTLPEGTERGRTDLGWLTIVKEECKERCAAACRTGRAGLGHRSPRAKLPACSHSSPLTQLPRLFRPTGSSTFAS